MTYSSGSLISASDYNGFATSVNSVWNTLWGQSSIGSVATGGTVTATQWATLASTITNAYTHESGSNPSVSSPSAGSTISVIANLSTAVTYITGHQYDCYASGTVYNTSGSATGPAKGSANTSWTMTFTNNIVFSSTATMNYFFYAGGRVLLNFSKSSTGLPADSAWNALPVIKLHLLVQVPQKLLPLSPTQVPPNKVEAGPRLRWQPPSEWLN